MQRHLPSVQLKINIIPTFCMYFLRFISQATSGLCSGSWDLRDDDFCSTLRWFVRCTVTSNQQANAVDQSYVHMPQECATFRQLFLRPAGCPSYDCTGHS
ncbi:hypothetical protein V2G26_016172 [Clonostachys chloroleuca]